MRCVRAIPLERIDWEDRTYEVRSFSDERFLRDSLARFGVIDLPWLAEKKSGYAIVDGFKRLRWASEVGEKSLEFRVLSDDVPSAQIWERRIGKKLFETGPNPAEKARMASVLLSIYPAGDAPGHLLAGLNVGHRPDTLRKWALLGNSDDETLEALGSGEISDRAALEISGWDSESRAALLRVLLHLRCSASIQVEIAERVNEISIREEKSRREILDHPALNEIMSGARLNHRQKTQALRDLLTGLRFPRLTRRQQRFQQDLQSLSLPPSIRIIPPPGFEGNGWRMDLAFTGREDLRKTIEKLRGLSESGRLNEILGGDTKSAP